MKMTPIQQNKLRLLKLSIDRAFRTLLASARKQSVLRIAGLRSLNAPLARGIDNLFTEVSGKASAPKNLGDISQPVGVVIAETIRYLYTSGECRQEVEAAVLRDLHLNGGHYELLSQMPQAKREYQRKEKRTLVESRADQASRKVAAWERKLKLAKTKLAKYKAKVKRYAKKGVIKDA